MKEFTHKEHQKLMRILINLDDLELSTDCPESKARARNTQKLVRELSFDLLQQIER